MTTSSSIAIEPVEQKDENGQTRKLREINQDGQLIYKEPTEASDKLTETLHRVWQERGDFNLIDAQELAEDPDFSIKPIEPDAEDEEEETPGEDGKMSYQAMAKMRGEILQNLNMARNEIWLVFELARTLVAAASQAAAENSASTVNDSKQGKGKKQSLSQNQLQNQAEKPAESQVEVKPAELEADANPLLLPVGSITTSTSVNPYQPLTKQVREMQLTLATQKQATLKCATMFEEAVKQMSDTNGRTESYWENVQRLRKGESNRGRWSLMAKPAFGVHAKAASNARDLAIPYALDEAGPSVRAQCLATFPLAHDAEKPLEYHARRYRRLRCQIISGSRKMSSSLPSTDDTTPAQSLFNAQREVFDGEVFAECVNEVRRSNIHGSVVLKNSVSIPASPDMSIIFSMYNTQEAQEPTEEPSPLCDAMLSSAHLLMLNVYRFRKTRLHLRNDGSLPSPAIVRPIINVMRFSNLAGRLREVVSAFAASLRTAGFSVKQRELSSFAGVDDWRIFFEDFRADDDIGISQMLAIEDCPVMSMSVAPPDQITISLPQATFAIEDLAELPEILTHQASQMLLGHLLRSLKESPDTSGMEMFVDELNDRLIFGRYRIRLSLPVNRGDVEATASAAGNAQQSWRASDDVGLEAWVRSLAAA